MTILDLDATSTGTGLIAAHFGNSQGQFRILLGQDLHDLRARESPPNQTDHNLHGSVHMMEKSLIAFAQVIQPRLPIRR